MAAMEADILLWIQNNIRNDVLTPIFKFITTLGNAGVIWIVLSVGLLIPKKIRYVGVHYPSDVLGGVLIGTGIALLTYWSGTDWIEQKA